MPEIDYHTRVRAEQVRIIYSQSNTMLIGNILGGGMLSLLQWHVVDHRFILGWYALILILTAIRWALCRTYQRSATANVQPEVWGRRYIFILLLIGSAWGFPFLFLFPLESPVYSVMMAMWIFGITGAGGISTYVVHTPTLLSQFLPVLLPGTIRLLVVGDRFHVIVGGCIVIYAYIVLTAARRIKKALVKSIEATIDLEIEAAEREKAMEEIKTLRGIIPICASCKNIRNDNGYWNQIENYLREHTDVEFTHGLCPKCTGTLYPELKPKQPS